MVYPATAFCAKYLLRIKSLSMYLIGKLANSPPSVNSCPVISITCFCSKLNTWYMPHSSLHFWALKPTGNEPVIWTDLHTGSRGVVFWLKNRSTLLSRSTEVQLSSMPVSLLYSLMLILATYYLNALRLAS